MRIGQYSLKYTMQYKTVSPTAVFITAQHPSQGLYYVMEGWHINLVEVLEMGHISELRRCIYFYDW